MTTKLWTAEHYADTNKRFNEQLTRLHVYLDKTKELEHRQKLVGELNYLANEIMFDVSQKIISLILDGHTVEILLFSGDIYTFSDQELVIKALDIDVTNVLAHYRDIKMVRFSGMVLTTDVTTWNKSLYKFFNNFKK